MFARWHYNNPRAGLVLALVLLAAPIHALEISLGSALVPAGGGVNVPVRVEAGSTPEAAALVLGLTYDTDQLTFEELRLEPAVAALGKSMDHEAGPAGLRAAIYGGAQPLPDGRLFVVRFGVNSEAQPRQPITLAGGDSSAATPDAEPAAVFVTPGVLLIEPDAGHHSADANQDWRFDISEILRLVQFYNFNAHHCDPTTEDGYAPGPGDTTTCEPHDSDYNPTDWRINLSEILRAIQIFNASGSYYRLLPGSEDGFGPGPVPAN